MYQVIGHSFTRSFRVMWALEELGQDYDYIACKPYSPEALAANPLGKVPALRIGDDVITDSSAILAYLADKHGALTAPAGTLERAHQDGVMHMVLDEMDAILWTAARHSFILPEEKRVPEVKPSLAWEFKRNCDRLLQVKKGAFIMGDEMTIVDIVAGHCIKWAASAKFQVEDEQLLAYVAMFTEREAYKRAASR